MDESGASSEKRSLDILGQLNFFNEAEMEQTPIRGTRMDRVAAYIQNRRSCLATYLEDGRCSFSNSLSENVIRPFTTGRNYAVNRIMFCSAV